MRLHPSTLIRSTCLIKKSTRLEWNHLLANRVPKAPCKHIPTPQLWQVSQRLDWCRRLWMVTDGSSHLCNRIARLIKILYSWPKSLGHSLNDLVKTTLKSLRHQFSTDKASSSKTTPSSMDSKKTTASPKKPLVKFSKPNSSCNNSKAQREKINKLGFSSRRKPFNRFKN